MGAVVSACRWACKLAILVLALLAGGCLALLARGAAAPRMVVRPPCGCSWAQPLPVAGAAGPTLVEPGTGPR